MGDTKKTAEIAAILGISEADCRQIAQEYDEILPGKMIGRIKIYDDNAVDRFRKIADLRAQGLPHEVIVPAIRGGKSLEERALEDMKKMGMLEEEKKAAAVPKPIPRSETEEELILAVRSAEAKVSGMEYKLTAIRENASSDTEKILQAIADLAGDVGALKDQVHTLWDQIADLETYLQESSQKKHFWEK
ncbi:MAG TPA: hypothetical protein O0X39_05115 [Methanocorpusculum sp.]|nr:hypothetical protein [Methanocorpusculum sp.]